MKQTGASQGARTAPVPTPAPSPPVEQRAQGDLERQIEEAVSEALKGVDNPAISRRDAGRLAQERINEAMSRFKSRLDGSAPQVVQVPFDPNMIPPQAVDIAMGFFLTVATIAIGLPLARAFARRMDRRGHVSVQQGDVAPRLDRIEQAIEAVAIEVERISEGQRYATKVMSEMRAIPAPNPAEAWPGGAARQPEAVARSSERGGGRT